MKKLLLFLIIVSLLFSYGCIEASSNKIIETYTTQGELCLDETEYYVYEKDEVAFMFDDFGIAEHKESSFKFSDYPDMELETKRGIKIGDPLEEVEEKYKGLNVSILDFDTGPYQSFEGLKKKQGETSIINDFRVSYYTYTVDNKYIDRREFDSYLRSQGIAFPDYFLKMDPIKNLHAYGLNFEFSENIVTDIVINTK